MESLVREILETLRTQPALDAASLDKLVRKRAAQVEGGRSVIAKKYILPYYLDTKAHNKTLWEQWNVDADLETRFIETVQVKPRRTASGVATVTVITKPAPCSGSCVFCPNDVRMPKSYLHDEPACQRAERNWFDPFLQVSARLETLENMGHSVEKVELIVLGGTFSDYKRSYRLWFASELFRALNTTGEERARAVAQRRALYEHAAIPYEPQDCAEAAQQVQAAINEQRLTYNEAVRALYAESSLDLSQQPENDLSAELAHMQTINETCAHRCVGLVVETRPDAITPALLRELRLMGCTKLQLGVQSIDDGILAANGRNMNAATIARAFGLARLFGFKIHAHFMANLVGSNPQADKYDYANFVADPAFSPDEVKLYPCALVDATELARLYREGLWRPYTEDELLDVLTSDLLATPPYTRVSRMIRDISANDILAGNKKANLRQMVEARLDNTDEPVREIRYREIATNVIDLDTLRLDEVVYETVEATEYFLQWVTPENRIAGFCRLSLPRPESVEALGDEAPVRLGEAMIRELHVYGFATPLSTAGSSAQHHGLGRALLMRAKEIARSRGYRSLNVISAIGTRAYYRKYDFCQGLLYQNSEL